MLTITSSPSILKITLFSSAFNLKLPCAILFLNSPTTDAASLNL